MPPTVTTIEEPFADIAADVLVVGARRAKGGVALAGDAVRDLGSRLGWDVLAHLEATGFKAKVGDVQIIPTSGRLPASEIAFAGLGTDADAPADAVRRASAAAAKALADRTSVASAVHSAFDDPAAAEASAEAFLLASYRFDKYKSDPGRPRLERISLLGAAPEALEAATLRADAVALARDLTNEPPGALTPRLLAERATEIATGAGLEIEVWDEETLAERGFAGIVNVGRGSAEPPRFVQLHYTPDGADRPLALVGKGITFDSGGLSLKDAKNMETMKTDMAGAAAVLATMSVLGRLGYPVAVHGYLCVAENMPGHNAIKPGDVIRHYGGKTSEVLNTDAEGRLVLADGLAFASEQGPAAIVDVATLTGSIMVALGRKATGLFSNDDGLAGELAAAAERAGERVWRMPLFDDYRSDIDSEIADVKNIGSRYGGSIHAALFLRDFVGKGIPWAHLDIAGAARAENAYDEMPKGGTGVAARTLLRWIEARAT